MSEKPEALEKEALRRRFAAEREALSEEEYARRSAEIVRRLLTRPELSEASTVHCYWPQVEKHEIDTRPLIQKLHEQGTLVALPVVTRFTPGAPRMTARRYAGPSSLHTNRWGLAEPAGTATVPPGTLDAVVVPAFGAGRNGHRIGHGRGYYDAFLQNLPATTLCPVYDACLIDEVPAEAHDVPMQLIVTETETFGL